MLFDNRIDAGRQLALELEKFSNDPTAIVIALPRGGVEVGYEVANILGLPIDIVCPRKIGAPFNPEFALGAVTETGEAIFSEQTLKQLGISQESLDNIVQEEKEKAEWRLKYYRKGREPRNLKDKIVILVDDGLATGSTMRAAIKTVRAERAKKILMAVPVAPKETLMKLKREVDEILCLYIPDEFYAVGQFYKSFEQTTDEQVIKLLNP